jgi:hypothetical protein
MAHYSLTNSWALFCLAINNAYPAASIDNSDPSIGANTFEIFAFILYTIAIISIV